MAEPRLNCASAAPLDETIRQAVQAYLARTGMSERKLGAFAAGDPSLVPRLMAGGSTTLHTADALLGYMEEPPIGPQFASEVEAFLTETGIGERQFGSKAAGDPSFVTKLRNGAGLRLHTVERVRAWMRVNKRALKAALRSGTGEPSPAASSDPAARDARAATTANPGSGDTRPLEGTTPARHDAKALLSTAEAAALLALSASTLKRYRAEGRGPPFLRLGGRVRYTRADLLKWALAHRQGQRPL